MPCGERSECALCTVLVHTGGREESFKRIEHGEVVLWVETTSVSKVEPAFLYIHKLWHILAQSAFAWSGQAH
eukprot:1273078-Pleurochrysis_carterae.AAC.1